MVKVLSRGNGTNHVVGRDPATGNNVTVMDNLSDSSLQARLRAGGGDDACEPVHRDNRVSHGGSDGPTRQLSAPVEN
jgi:hypothetical protein